MTNSPPKGWGIGKVSSLMTPAYCHERVSRARSREYESKWYPVDLHSQNSSTELTELRVWGNGVTREESHKEREFLRPMEGLPQEFSRYCQTQAPLMAQWYRIRLPSRRGGLDSWVGRIPWRRKWQPTLVFLPGKSHGQRSLVCCSPWGPKELNTTQRVNNINCWEDVREEPARLDKDLPERLSHSHRARESACPHSKTGKHHDVWGHWVGHSMSCFVRNVE